MGYKKRIVDQENISLYRTELLFVSILKRACPFIIIVRMGLSGRIGLNALGRNELNRQDDADETGSDFSHGKFVERSNGD